jgi:alkanesulfonate monooxygenase SsuD/methylene tetrahydromethanopterin reductase-like flavin-dependent oxidoreductase (luciferase family)
MDPFVALTAAACATKKLKIGTGIALVIQRDTIQTAKLVASTGCRQCASGHETRPI